jgi:hypothetical protein
VDSALRIVDRLPLRELWDANGSVAASRGANLSGDQVREHLRVSDRGVVATIGQRPRWLHGPELFEWWKNEARLRLVDPELSAWRLEDYPDERCWIASAWTLDDGATAIAFEEYH